VGSQLHRDSSELLGMNTGRENQSSAPVSKFVDIPLVIMNTKRVACTVMPSIYAAEIIKEHTTETMHLN
jgi:hypothetical protein